MNERIKQLAKQAGLRFTQLMSNPMVPVVDGKETDLEKFAELLMLECVNAVMDGTREGDHYAMRIEQHFDNGPGGILHFGVE